MSQRFLNGALAAKAQMAVSIIADIQATNTEAMLELYPQHEEALGHAAIALQDIANKLRTKDHDRGE